MVVYVARLDLRKVLWCIHLYVMLIASGMCMICLTVGFSKKKHTAV